VTTLSLAAVGSFGRESGITLSADHLFAFVFSGESHECGFEFHGSHTTTGETQDEMEGRFFLDVILLEGTSIFELLSGENQTLLVWWDAFLVLDFGPGKD